MVDCYSLAQGPQRSDAGETRTLGPLVSSQALYLWATALPNSLDVDNYYCNSILAMPIIVSGLERTL